MIAQLPSARGPAGPRRTRYSASMLKDLWARITGRFASEGGRACERRAEHEPRGAPVRRGKRRRPAIRARGGSPPGRHRSETPPRRIAPPPPAVANVSIHDPTPGLASARRSAGRRRTFHGSDGPPPRARRSVALWAGAATELLEAPGGIEVVARPEQPNRDRPGGVIAAAQVGADCLLQAALGGRVVVERLGDAAVAGQRGPEVLVPADQGVGAGEQLAAGRAPIGSRRDAGPTPQVEHGLGREAQPGDAGDEAGHLGER